MSTATIPPAITRAYPGVTVAPTVVEIFIPGRGWEILPPLTDADQRHANANRKRYAPVSRRIDRGYARALARMGVTAVSVRIGRNRRADFTTAELCRKTGGR